MGKNVIKTKSNVQLEKKENQYMCLRTRKRNHFNDRYVVFTMLQNMFVRNYTDYSKNIINNPSNTGNSNSTSAVAAYFKPKLGGQKEGTSSSSTSSTTSTPQSNLSDRN